MDFATSDVGPDPSKSWGRAPRARAPSLRLDPDDPEYLAKRFLGLCYRTTRAILAQRQLLVLGQSLNEAQNQRISTQPDLFDSKLPLPANHPLRDNPDLSLLHGYTALQIGIDPDDPVLHWLETPHFLTFFPEPEALLDFEAQFLPILGRALIASGRHTALRRAQGIVGPISQMERRDFLSLPYAYLREVSEVSSLEERTLAVARLEAVAHRAKNSLDPRVELAALRQISTLQGLNFQDPDKGHREMILLLAKGQTQLQIDHDQ